MNTRILGIDIGGTKISAGVVRGKQVTDVHTIPTVRSWTREKFFSHLLSLIEQFTQRYDLSAIGVGVPGTLNGAAHDPRITSAPNLPALTGARPLSRLRRAVKLPIRIENDAHCFTLAEARYGAGANKNVVVGITIGTGIGSGIVLHGDIYRGYAYASEFGHMIIEAGGTKCPCGNRGCWERYASGSAMQRLYKKRTGRTKHPSLIDEEARRRGTAAVAVVRTTSTYLGIGLGNIINVLDPDVIVLGGSVVRNRDIIALARKEATQHLMSHDPHTKILPATLPHPAILGAALIAR